MSDEKEFLICKETLKNIADSIRNVSGEEDKLSPAEMASEIKRLTAVIDQNYDATSKNPQSGIAVSQAIEGEEQLREASDKELSNRIDTLSNTVNDFDSRINESQTNANEAKVNAKTALDTVTELRNTMVTEDQLSWSELTL